VQATLGPTFEVQPPSARGRQFEALLQSYSAALTLSSLFALIVGMFIIYNSFSIAVTQRRSEIGILRALGATRGQVQRLFFLESIAAGFVGSALGAGLGMVMASTITTYLSAMVEQSAGVAQRVSNLAFDPQLIATGIAIGIVTSVVAAWIPARSAARVDPVQALQKGKYQILSAGENRKRVWTAFILFLVSLGCLLFRNPGRSSTLVTL
jgi:putative ABC transport system permease protein